ncbi:hypothetical protein HPB48_020572 [Haemaphysalis longicornis]|uniref:Uncharacterized protein n=1 Tax=Haemaphysalis longicornis TaxID=44386 RepID=A0A9J6GV31_HAELO|nr:hypothetical protein HPB48_020572 [Haemaphysalis longicornis]
MVHWRSPISEVDVEEVKLRQRMGGRGEVVQVGETLYRGSRRPNKYRQLACGSVDRGRFRGPWVAGFVLMSTEEFRLLKVKRWDSDSLWRLIEPNVRPDTSVGTERSAGYLCVHC